MEMIVATLIDAKTGQQKTIAGKEAESFAKYWGMDINFEDMFLWKDDGSSATFSPAPDYDWDILRDHLQKAIETADEGALMDVAKRLRLRQV